MKKILFIIICSFVTFYVFSQDISKNIPQFQWNETVLQLKEMFPGLHDIPKEGNSINYSSCAADNVLFGSYSFNVRFVMDANTDKLIRAVFKPMQELNAETSKILFGYIYAKLEDKYGVPQTIKGVDKSTVGLCAPEYVWILDNKNIHLTGWWLNDENSTQFLIDNKSMTF